MKETIIFDLGGVLIHLNVSRCMQAFEKLMGEENMRMVLGMDIHGEGVKAVSIGCKQLMADYERGLVSTENFVREILPFCAAGTTEQQIIDAWMSMLSDLPAERLAFIDSLREKGHKVYLLSNGNDLHFEYIDRTYGLAPHFDGLFLSQKMHVAKPEKEIFEAVQQDLKLQQKTDIVYFIDDIEANRKAAETFAGWRTFVSVEEFANFFKI